MILTYGDVSLLTGLPWFVLELRSERTSEEILKRMGKEAPKTFQEDPLEVFVPVVARDLDVFQLSTENYIFVRSTSPQKIAKLKHITGVVQILCEGDTQRVSKFIPIDDEYVQGLIEEAEKRHLTSSSSVRVGSFVRILDGYTKDFCGEVMSIGHGYACVKLDLKTKIILVETPMSNLLDLSHIAAESRVFYFSPPVAEFVEHFENDATAILAEDLKFEEHKAILGSVPLAASVLPTHEAPAPSVKNARTRQFTVTAELRRALDSGVTHPLDLVKVAAERVRRGELKPTTNLTIFWHTVRSMVFNHLKATRPDLGLKEYKQVRAIWPDYAVPMSVIKGLLPGIPVKTPKDARTPTKPRLSKKAVALVPPQPPVDLPASLPPLPEPPVGVAHDHDFLVPAPAPTRKKRRHPRTEVKRRSLKPSLSFYLRPFVMEGNPTIEEMIQKAEAICETMGVKIPRTSLTFSKAIRALLIEKVRKEHPEVSNYTQASVFILDGPSLTARKVVSMVRLYQKLPSGVDPGTVYGAPVSDAVPLKKEVAPVLPPPQVSLEEPVEVREEVPMQTPTPKKTRRAPQVVTYEADMSSPLIIHGAN